jgi:hypothetical protein
VPRTSAARGIMSLNPADPGHPFRAGNGYLVRQVSHGLADHVIANRHFPATSELPNTDMAPPASGAGRPAVLAEIGVIVVDLERDMPAVA